MHALVATNFSGEFFVSGIPAGGVLVNVSAPGYNSVLVEVFLSSIYTTVSGGAPLVVTLTESSGAPSTTVVADSFPTLENLLASLGSGAVLLGASALISGLGARAAFRRGPVTHAIVGGAAALVRRRRCSPSERPSSSRTSSCRRSLWPLWARSRFRWG